LQSERENKTASEQRRETWVPVCCFDWTRRERLPADREREAVGEDEGTLSMNERGGYGMEGAERERECGRKEKERRKGVTRERKPS